MNVIPGTLAEGTETPLRPYRIRDSGRLDPDPSQWTRPLPPLLWERLDDERRQAHERAVEAYAEAHERAVELSAKARQQAADDEQALREAVAAGSKVPKAKAPALEAAAEEAQRAQEMAAQLVLESGGALAEGLTEDDVQAAVREAKAEAETIVSTVPELVDRLLEELQEAARLGAQAAWCGRLQERRLQPPWRPGAQPLTHRLAAAAEAARLLQAHVSDELAERDWKSAGPPQHHAPAGAPPAGSWVTAAIDPTR